MKSRKKSRSAKTASKGAGVPYGYRKKGERLEPQPEDAAVVRQLFADYVSLDAAITASVQDYIRSIRSRRAQLARRHALVSKGGR